MKPSDEELVTRFIDGELEGKELADFETRLENDPELREATEGVGAIGEGIRGIFADADVVGHDIRMAATSLADVEIPNADAFTSSILDQIGASSS